MWAKAAWRLCKLGRRCHLSGTVSPSVRTNQCSSGCRGRQQSSEDRLEPKRNLILFLLLTLFCLTLNWDWSVPTSPVSEELSDL